LVYDKGLSSRAKSIFSRDGLVALLNEEPLQPGGGFEDDDIDPDLDPELAMAIRISLQEAREREREIASIGAVIESNDVVKSPVKMRVATALHHHFLYSSCQSDLLCSSDHTLMELSGYCRDYKYSNSTDSLCGCNICGTQVKLSETYYHCDVCTNFDCCLKCSLKLKKSNAIIDEETLDSNITCINNSSLALAVINENIELVDTFLKVPNININTKNSIGQTALDIAKIKGNDELVSKLVIAYNNASK